MLRQITGCDSLLQSGNVFCRCTVVEPSVLAVFWFVPIHESADAKQLNDIVVKVTMFATALDPLRIRTNRRGDIFRTGCNDLCMNIHMSAWA